MSKLKNSDYVRIEAVEQVLSELQQLNINELRELVLKAAKIGIGIHVSVEPTTLIENHKDEDTPETSEPDKLSEEDMAELSENYVHRTTTPKAEWIKVTKADDVFDLVMQDKQKNGWKFKDEV